MLQLIRTKLRLRHLDIILLKKPKGREGMSQGKAFAFEQIIWNLSQTYSGGIPFPPAVSGWVGQLGGEWAFPFWNKKSISYTPATT